MSGIKHSPAQKGSAAAVIWQLHLHKYHSHRLFVGGLYNSLLNTSMEDDLEHCVCVCVC